MSEAWTPDDALVEKAARAISLIACGFEQSWRDYTDDARAALVAAHSDIIAAERAVVETLVATLKQLRDDYRNDSEHARLIDAVLKAAEGR